MHLAIATPRPIDAHDIYIKAALEFDTLALAVPIGHMAPRFWMVNPLQAEQAPGTRSVAILSTGFRFNPRTIEF